MTPMGGRARLTADLHFGNLQSNDYSPALSIASARGHISPQLQSNLGFLPEQHEGHFLHPMDGLYPIAFNQFSSNPHPGPRFTDGKPAWTHIYSRSRYCIRLMTMLYLAATCSCVKAQEMEKQAGFEATRQLRRPYQGGCALTEPALSLRLQAERQTCTLQTGSTPTLWRGI